MNGNSSLARANSDRKLLLPYLLAQFSLLLVFYWEFLVGSKQFFIRDLGNFFEPLCRFISREIAQGRFPLWNPYAYCGMSQIAITSPSILYPPAFLFCALPFGSALALFLIFSQIICALGTYLLVESLGWGALAAISSAAAISLSGYMFCLSGNFTMVATASWFPMLIWSINNTKDINSSQGWKTLLIAVSLFMMLTAGRPEIWLPAIVVCSAFAAYSSIFQSEKSQRLKRLFFLVRALLIGVLLSMPSIIPSLEWVPLSRRAGGLASSEILMFSANWYDFLSMFASLPLGDLQLRMAKFQALVDPHSLGRFLGSSFVSSFVIALAFLGLEPGPSKKYSPLMICAVATIASFAILSAAGNLPLVRDIVPFIPGASLLRFPSKLLFFFSFGLAVLAARGLRNYLQGTLQMHKHLALWIFLLLLFILLFFQSHVILPFTDFAIANQALAIEAQKLISWHCLLWSAGAVALLLSMWLLARRGQSNFAASIACVACVIAVYGSAFSYYRNGAPPDYFDSASSIANKIKEYSSIEHKHLRYAPVYIQGFTIPQSYRGVDQLSSTLLAGQYSRQILNAYSNIDFGIASAYGYEGAMKGDYFFSFMDTYGRSSQYIGQQSNPASSQSDLPLFRFLQLSSCPYAITQCFRDVPAIKYSGDTRPVILPTIVPRLDPRLFILKHEDERLNARIYETNQAMPHAYLSYKWRICKDNDEIIHTILNCDKNDFDPHRYSIIHAAEDSSASAVPKANSAENLTFEPLELKGNNILDANAKSPCLLVLADQFYPGWKARVDGVETPIYRCNGFMRAIFLKQGEHHIQFSYEPESFRNGILLALIAIAWLLALFTGERFIKPRSQH